MNKQELSALSGDKEGQGSPKLIVNQIKLNGGKGVFIKDDVKGGLQDVAENKKAYAKEILGNDTLNVVFLKIRRKLVQYRKGKKNLATNEHNHSGQKVILYGDTVEKGVASELREKYSGLRTQQIVYALYKGELVKVIFKGSSLGSSNTDKSQHDFYSYISSFQNDEHFFEYETNLIIKEEFGDLGSYFKVVFERGRKLTDEEMEAVAENLKMVAGYCSSSDNYYMSLYNQGAEKIEKMEMPEDDTLEIEYPEDDTPADIPF